MNNKPTIVIDGMRVQINGREFLIIITPIFHGDVTRDQADEVLTQLFAGVNSQCTVVPAYLKSDSTLQIFAPAGCEEEFRGKTFSASQLTKIPIYPDDLKRF